MTKFDYAVLAFYFAYMLAISWFFRRFVHNVSDYFRSGGQVLWWMAGGSTFMVSFSAWTFTGAASRAYGDGWPIMIIYVANAVGFIFSAFYFAPRFRQLRVITSMQAVRARFGAANEQIFTWLWLPLRVMYGGIWLYGLAVFCAAAFQLDVSRTILLAGGTVILVALISGSWAVVASDFIQVLILMPVTLVAAVLAVEKLGGPAAYVHRLSASRLDFHKLFSDDFLWFWCLATLVKQFVVTNNLSESYRFLLVKDSRHARRAALLAGALMLVGIVIWFVPPMAASITAPDLARIYPQLQDPGAVSFFAIAAATFPVGMIGLLVSGIFAATMSAMDSGLNNNAGIFVKNFYQLVLRPQATERELLLVGKGATVVLGAMIVALALVYSHVEQLSLFKLMVGFGTRVALPLTIPLVLGIFVRRTPPWSAWSTVLLGLVTAWASDRYLTVDRAVRVFGAHHAALNTWEVQNWDLGVATTLIVVLCTVWFCGSCLFYGRSSAAYRAAIEEFSLRIEAPVDYDREEAAPATDDKQSWLIGCLCLPYGALICLLALIPNPPSGRLAFLFCGGVVLLVGGLLVKTARRTPPPAPLAASARPTVGRLVVAASAAEIAGFLPEPLWEEVRRLGEPCVVLPPDGPDLAAFYRELAALDPEVLVAGWSTPALPARLPPRLRYVCYLAGSVKKLLTREHLERGLLVTNWGGAISRVVAECALLLTLAALRRCGHWIPAMHGTGTWKQGRAETASLFGRRVGLHGFGRVARQLIPLLQPFGVEIGICAPETDPALYAAHGAVRVASLAELFAGCDVIIEVAPLNAATAGIVTEPLLRLIRPGGVFVNVGRGGVIDEAALARVARDNRILIALDVYVAEPLAAHSELRGLPNVILLPHLAGPTTDRQRDAGELSLRNLRAFAEGRSLEAVITPEVFDLSS
jgi:solute:Na+ symporter, SSS family